VMRQLDLAAVLTYVPAQTPQSWAAQILLDSQFCKIEKAGFSENVRISEDLG
jgi:hypothetical protein